MRSPLTIAVVFAAVVVAAGAALATPLRSGGRLTTVPPAFYAGTSRAETLYGSNANDVLLGRGGNDTLYGRGGNDVVDGAPGTTGSTAAPVATPSPARSGNDRLYARDGRRDTVNGGPGFDEAWVDRLDVVRNVERVHRPIAARMSPDPGACELADAEHGPAPSSRSSSPRSTRRRTSARSSRRSRGASRTSPRSR